MKYEVQTKFVFSGSFQIEAESAYRAKELTKRNCELVIEKEIHFVLNGENFDWAFSRHVDKIPGKARRIRRKE